MRYIINRALINQYLSAEDLSSLDNLIEDIKQLLFAFPLISITHALEFMIELLLVLIWKLILSTWFIHAQPFIPNVLLYDCNRK